MELVNNPDDLVGAFSSQSIADIIYPNCPDILAKFIQVAPLEGINGTRNSVWTGYETKIGGYIPSNSEHPYEAFSIMDMMLSDEAALIAEFGEENVDWRYSENGELSTYSTQAKITTINYLKDCIQNKNFADNGPHVLEPKYSNGVTWNGDNSQVEYIDARAIKLYENYYFNDNEIENIINKEYNNNEYQDIKKYLDGIITKFINGKLDVDNDIVWNKFIDEYNKKMFK